MIMNMEMRLFIIKITRQYFIFKIILVVPYKNELTSQTDGNENVKDPTNHQHEQPTKSNIIPQPTGNIHALNPKTNQIHARNSFKTIELFYTDGTYLQLVPKENNFL